MAQAVILSAREQDVQIAPDAEIGNGEALRRRTDMKRLTHEADFGFEDWEETLFFVESDPNGAYNILDIARYQGEPEFDNILKNIVRRLAAIENILGNEYELDKLRELVAADKEGRCVVFSPGYPVASNYHKDDYGSVIREVAGVVSAEEYEAATKAREQDEQ